MRRWCFQWFLNKKIKCTLFFPTTVVFRFLLTCYVFLLLQWSYNFIYLFYSIIFKIILGVKVFNAVIWYLVRGLSCLIGSAHKSTWEIFSVPFSRDSYLILPLVIIFVTSHALAFSLAFFLCITFGGNFPAVNKLQLVMIVVWLSSYFTFIDFSPSNLLS